MLLPSLNGETTLGLSQGKVTGLKQTVHSLWAGIFKPKDVGQQKMLFLMVTKPQWAGHRTLGALPTHTWDICVRTPVEKKNNQIHDLVTKKKRALHKYLSNKYIHGLPGML